MDKVKRTLFLDRDGVINEHVKNGYVLSANDFKIKDDFFKEIGKIAFHFDYIIVITNQSPLGRGLLSLKALYEINLKLLRKAKLYSINITDILYSPGQDNNCVTRKPNTGMFEYALRSYNDINLDSSIFIGDSYSDYQAAKKLGVSYYNLKGADEFYKSLNIENNFDNINELIKNIIFE